ncbi:MAG TPA: TerC family protein [Aestuariivirgaceae bacterium]|jgi:predicted tellurium resistance membrane protein TerC
MSETLLALVYDPAAWSALAALIAMEIVLGIDNLIFVSIISNKLGPDRRDHARRLGLALALVLRLALLAAVAFVVQLTEPVLAVWGMEFSWRDMILIAGGLFLVWKATKEIHHNVDPDPGPDIFDRKTAAVTFGSAIVQILILDLVFSIDSIVTAVGMTDHVPIMMIAVIVAVIVMLLASGPLSRFIHANPTIVMLALGFLLMIGMALIADGFGVHIPKGYIYAAMAFSTFIESLNLISRRAKRKLRAKNRS